MAKLDAILTPNPVLPNHVIKIDPAKCIACYQCAEICRCNVLMENPDKTQPPILVYPEECWHCAACTENCPTGAIEFDHPINQKITWKRKDTGQLFRIGMKNPPAPCTKKACGDRNIYLDESAVIDMKVMEAARVSRYVVKVILGKTDSEIPQYKPGNFCNIKVGEDTYRGYSFANAYNNEYIELYVDIFPNGPGANFFKAARVGMIVQVLMPYGKFIYESSSRPLLLIGSVTGISPLKAILEQELHEIKSGRKIMLLFQVWSEEDLFLAEYFNEMKSILPTFEYKVFYADPEKNNGITIQNYLANDAAISKDLEAYICGSKPLIKSVERILFDRGVFWRNIHYESFIS
ncbi:hypothetical protein MASR2M70_21130 [Bacillota bacterium]